MLFNYTYVPHPMERMQEFIDFIFIEVWCEAPLTGHFDLRLFDGNADLKELMERFLWEDTNGGDFFYSHVERIFGLFVNLDDEQITLLKNWYRANNAIEEVCLNSPNTDIARYKNIQAAHPKNTDDTICLYTQLARFFKGLYSQSLLNLAIVKEKIGDIDDHYKAFMAENTIGKCPFCGITDLLAGYHTRREAYDHYLPKGHYPFNSINFRNLVPACHYCNSSYKTMRDPAYTAKDPAGEIHRRKAFYPFSVARHQIDVDMELVSKNIDNLHPNDIQLSFGPDNISEEIETWKDVYGIEERYRAKCCTDSDGKSWFNRVFQERKNYNLGVEDMLHAELQTAENQPYSDSNFLKKSFLKACNEAGLFDSQ